MKKKSFLIIRIIFLICYIICVAVLITESSLNASISSNHSSTVGGYVAGIINDVKGDQTEVIKPTKVEITNKLSNGAINAKTGDSLQLSVKTTPSDSTYQSYIYSSSNNKVATVDENGLVKFLSEGSATITATNTNCVEVNASVKVKVTNVKLEKITPKIISNNEYIDNPIKNSDGYYTLYKDVSYSLDYDIYPLNATDSTVKFSTKSKSIILDATGVITPLEMSSNPIEITLACACGEIKENIYVIIESPIETTLSRLQATNLTIYATQTITTSNIYAIYDVFNISDNTTTESKVKYTSYTLTSNSSLISITGNKIKGVAPGEAIVTATSKDNPSLFVVFNVIIKEQDKLTDYSISNITTGTNTLAIGSTKTLSFKYLPNSYAKINSKSFTSSNPDIISINSSGQMTAKMVSDEIVTITVNINDIIKTFSIKVIEKTTTENEDGEKIELSHFTANISNNIFKVNDEIKLSDLISTTWYDTNNNICSNSAKPAYWVDELEGTIENNVLIPKAAGLISLYVRFDGYDDYILDLYAVSDYDILDENNTNYKELSSFNLNINDIIFIQLNA